MCLNLNCWAMFMRCRRFNCCDLDEEDTDFSMSKLLLGALSPLVFNGAPACSSLISDSSSSLLSPLLLPPPPVNNTCPHAVIQRSCRSQERDRGCCSMVLMLSLSVTIQMIQSKLKFSLTLSTIRY